MPLGLVRLNERRQRPNQNISFIKVKDGPEKEIAEDILERVAAIVWPIMRDNGLGVMSLEDFPPNREFWGRNFNAGECIQLVLKSPSTGLWLPFSFVCKVMLHELAHIKQMNHSKAFHVVRIGYHKEFDALVAKGYTGEGFWSRGHTISEGLTAPRHLSEAEMPDNLCGGTYRTAKKPEKRKLTYAERKEKRKQRLFGKGEGEQIGSNEKLRAALEKGKSKKAVAVKPRVAQSKRGRDLRLEAALRREEALRIETSASTSDASKEKSGDDDDDRSEYETEDEEETVDVGGGNRMVRVASEGQDDDEWAEFRDEMNNMCAATALDGAKASSSVAGSTHESVANQKGSAVSSLTSREHSDNLILKEDSESDSKPDDTIRLSALGVNKIARNVKLEEQGSEEDEDTPPPTPRKEPKSDSRLVGRAATLHKDEKNESGSSFKNAKPKGENDDDQDPSPPRVFKVSHPFHAKAAPAVLEEVSIVCSVCTMQNPSSLALCAACGNVLDIDRTPSWKCESTACRVTAYSNPNDAALCGCCGHRRRA